jgi:hypothetical protein
VYPSSDFKYYTRNDIEYDHRDFDFPTESGKYCSSRRSDSSSDYDWDPLVFGIAFFREQRTRHYERLNRYVFKLILGLELSNVGYSRDSIADYYRIAAG